MKRFLPYICLLLALPAGAAPLAREDVPKPLAPWIDWVLVGEESKQCPPLQGGAEQVCAWPGALTLALDGRGGSFRQNWRFYADGWAQLPGAERRWPQGVTVDGKPALVVEHGGGPQVYLKRGAHSVAGRFAWDSLPQMLEVPKHTGVLALNVRGKAVPFPVRDNAGRVWVQKKSSFEKEKSALEVIVHRKVADDIPLQLTTHIQLKVSGKSREVLLGRALPENFIPLALRSPLPARIEKDGRLRVQVRPGTWNITLEARHDGPAAALTLGEPGGDWDEGEVWVFESRSQLRVVHVEGPPTVDPQQTELPPGWRRFPAYIMAPDSVMQLVERRRGDADPEPDRLTLTRVLWLDFDGRGYSVQDRLRGKLHRSWRLEMAPATRLGRVAVGGRDQFITALEDGGAAGVEVRQQDVDIVADSRIEDAAGRLPAVGWRHDVDSLAATLHLPAGWRLLHASGVDTAGPTWVTRWNLLDFFLVIIIAIGVGMLWGKPWGAAALAGLVLSWHEPLAPKWIWLVVLACEALTRELPDGRVKQAARVARGGAWGLLLLILVPFAVVEVRSALYPQLEGRGRSGYGMLRKLDNVSLNLMAAKSESVVEGTGYFSPGSAPAEDKAGVKPRAGRSLPGKPHMSKMLAQAPAYAQHYTPDPNAKVNTGPGLPRWQWHQVHLTWQGPVKRDHEIRLWLLSPRLRGLLSVARLSLLTLLLLLALNLPLADWWQDLRAGGGLKKFSGWLLPGLLLALAPGVRAGDYPPKEMLDTLKTRLTEDAACRPRCAESPRLRVEAAGNTLRLRMTVMAQADTAVPLPGGEQQWTPARVVVGEAAARGLHRTANGRLWLPLAKGVHTVLLEGPLPERETVQIPLPLKPRRVETSAAGWQIDGVHEDGLADDTLQLTRLRSPKGGARSLEPGQLPPFVMVTRTLNLGLSWHVQTQVSRQTPLGAPVVLEVPLLPGEEVMSEGMRVKDGKAVVNMGPQTRRVGWNSRLKAADALTLRAPAGTAWVERWLLAAGPIWHIAAAGIPTVYGDRGGQSRLREWRPWPGEKVELTITRPEGMPGQTLTVDQAALQLSPGLRAADATLELVLRSSRGGEHALTLPENADLQQVLIDGQAQPIRQEGRKVVLPVPPGRSVAQLQWREHAGLGMFYRTSEIDLGSPSVNAGLTVKMPRKRWTLLLGGPKLGPAVLFWSLLIVFLLVSFGLGRMRLTPLRWPQWFLLSLGLTQAPIPVAAVVAGWLLLLGWRRSAPRQGRAAFNMTQVFLVGWTLAAFGCLFGSITHGLLGLPDMQISGNGSRAAELLWYQDRAAGMMPRAWIFSVPLFLYRAAMLGWALWLAASLLKWLKWGWRCFSAGGLWKSGEAPAAPKP